jgi:hypothetical protein
MNKAALRDPRVWVLFFSFAKVFLSAVGVDIAPERWAVYEEAFNAACAFFVALGIFAYDPYQYEDKDKDNDHTDDLRP